MRKNYIFKPYIPKNYGNSDLGRLFLVGDSHYIKHEEKDLSNFTKDIISKIADYSFIKFFREVGKIFNPSDYTEIFSKAAFANAIQVGMKEASQKPNIEDFKTVEPALKDYLEEIKPSKMVVFSKRVWNYGLPQDISWGEYVETIVDQKTKYEATVWKFNYQSGVCHGIGVYHPSYPGFNSQKMKSLLDIFFSREYL